MCQSSSICFQHGTWKDKHKYMGYIPPGMGKNLQYAKFPMGSPNSLGASGWYGNAFTWYLLENCPECLGYPFWNEVMAALINGKFDPKHGTGCTLIGKGKLISCMVWIHVDDTKTHGPTKEKLEVALHYILDTDLQLGLICQPVKMKPPQQIQKFCAFIYDPGPFHIWKSQRTKSHEHWCW